MDQWYKVFFELSNKLIASNISYLNYKKRRPNFKRLEKLKFSIQLKLW